MNRDHTPPKLLDITAPSGERAAMNATTNLRLASTGEILRELARRGYRTFPAHRFIERYCSWTIAKTPHEIRGNPDRSRVRKEAAE